MDDATRPDAREEVNCAPLTTKADQLLAVLAAGPCTLADLATVSRDPHDMLREIRQHGAVILYDRKAKPPTYRLERMPTPPTPKAKPDPKPKPEPEPEPPLPLKGWLSAESFEVITGLPANTIPLRWSAGKFPPQAVFEQLQAAASRDKPYRPALTALATMVARGKL